MTGSTFGKLFKVSTWGESHGEALGCIIEGVPSKIKITEKFIQKFEDVANSVNTVEEFEKMWIATFN